MDEVSAERRRMVEPGALEKSPVTDADSVPPEKERGRKKKSCCVTALRGTPVVGGEGVKKGQQLLFASFLHILMTLFVYLHIRSLPRLRERLFAGQSRIRMLTSQGCARPS